MPSTWLTVVTAAAAFAVASRAQFNVDPSSVPYSTRQAWCANEKDTCPLICQQMEPRTTLINDCDPRQLTYGCLCGNNQRPNVSEYTLTLPYFICQEWGNQCVKACKTDNTCASNCHEKHPCGASNPKKINSKSTASGTTKPTASATEDPTIIYSDTPSSAKGDSRGAGVTVAVGRTYGMAIVLTGLFAGFALL